MIIQLKVTYGPTTTNGSFEPSAPFSGYGFDTDALSIIGIAGTWRGAFLEPKPADVFWSPTVPFWWDCANATAANDYAGVAYYHVLAAGSGYGTTRTEPAPQCPACGYTPPVDPPPVCNLTAAAALVLGQQVTLSATGNRGPLRFSLDDGLTVQSSGVFRQLAAGDYTGTIIDTGTANCRRPVTFRVVGAVGPLPDLPAPTGAPESLALALRPEWETIGGFAPGTLVRLELWLESRHQLRDYERIFRGQKVAGADGVVSFRLDAQLRSRLQHIPLSATAETCVLADQAARNYFCRTKVVDVATGLERDPVNRPLRTVLLASLDQDGYFLSNQPNNKVLYPGQVETLYWRSPRVVSGTITVRRAVALANGLSTVETEEVALATTGAARYRLLAVPVLPGGVLPAGAVRVEVQMVNDENEALSEIRVYQVQQPAYATVRQFLFANPFGGLDTLVATGASSKSLEVKAETAERAELQGDTAATAQAWAWSFEEQRRQRVALGWLRPDQFHWLQGFMLARQIWHYLRGEWVPILPVKRQLGFARDKPVLEGLTFEFELANADANREEVR